MARIGKIARLPAATREELNRRLRDGAQQKQLLPWLNGLPEVQLVLSEHFNGQAINAQNLSDWAQHGYLEWLEKQDTQHQRLERIRELSKMSMELARENAGNLSEGAASLLGGQILEVLELLDGVSETTDEDPKARVAALSEALEGLTLAVSRLRKGDHNQAQLRLNEERLRQKEREMSLAREEFEHKKAEWEEKVQKQKNAIQAELTQARAGGLTPETLQRIEEAARLL